MKLSIEKIEKSFGDKEVLKGIDLAINSGRAMGILGRNGAGKTTLLRIVMDVFPADGGKILLDGKKIDRAKVKVGYLPEERGMYPQKPVMEQLIYFGILTGASKRDVKSNAEKLLKRLDMSEYSNKKLSTLSKGNQQKIQLIATLVAEPDIVILDEPFSGLDPVNAMLLKELVKELISKDKLVIFSSHQMSYVEEFCDDIAVLNRGKIVLSGSVSKIKRDTDRKNITIKTENAARLKEEIDEKMSSFIESASIAGDEVTLKLNDKNDKNKLLAAIAQSPVDIDGIRVYEPSINDLFVKYTQDSI